MPFPRPIFLLNVPILQAELLKLQHFRRFLKSSKFSQLYFLLKVETVRRAKEAEEGEEVDEKGYPFSKTG